MPDETLYKDAQVHVTTTRIVVGDTTYSLRNITSVKTDSDPTAMGCGAVLMGFGGLGLIMGISNSRLDVGLTFAVLLGGIGYALFALLKTKYSMMFVTSAGQVTALSSRNEEYIRRVVQAVNDAIARQS